MILRTAVYMKWWRKCVYTPWLFMISCFQLTSTMQHYYEHEYTTHNWSCERIQQSPQLSWSASTVQHEPQHWYTQRAQWQQLPKMDTPQGKYLHNYIQCTMLVILADVTDCNIGCIDVTHCNIGIHWIIKHGFTNISVTETCTCMHWFKVVLLVPQNIKTDDIHKPSQSRECSQWKHELGEENNAVFLR